MGAETSKFGLTGFDWIPALPSTASIAAAPVPAIRALVSPAGLALAAASAPVAAAAPLVVPLLAASVEVRAASELPRGSATFEPALALAAAGAALEAGPVRDYCPAELLYLA